MVHNVGTRVVLRKEREERKKTILAAVQKVQKWSENERGKKSRHCSRKVETVAGRTGLLQNDDNDRCIEV